jgi:hypothetical protein
MALALHAAQALVCMMRTRAVPSSFNAIIMPSCLIISVCSAKNRAKVQQKMHIRKQSEKLFSKKDRILSHSIVGIHSSLLESELPTIE